LDRLAHQDPLANPDSPARTDSPASLETPARKDTLATAEAPASPATPEATASKDSPEHREPPANATTAHRPVPPPATECDQSTIENWRRTPTDDDPRGCCPFVSHHFPDYFGISKTLIGQFSMLFLYLCKISLDCSVAQKNQRIN
jgi:hypothetical protein